MTFLWFAAAFLLYFSTLGFCFTHFESRHHPARYFIFFSLPAAILIFLFAVIYLYPSEGPAAAREPGNWLWLHLGLILSGLAGLLTAVSSAMMYLLQSSQLKSKHPGAMLFKLPSLDALDRMNFASLVWGTILFSFGILSGILWAHDLQRLGPVLQDKKVILSLATCFMYWCILLLRVSSLRRGHKIAVGTVFVFILLFVTIVSSHDVTRYTGLPAGALVAGLPAGALVAGRL